MAEEPKEEKQNRELKATKFNKDSILTIQQWIKFIELKCKQMHMKTDELLDQLIDLFEGEALAFYIEFLSGEKSWKQVKEKLILQYGTKQEDILTEFLSLKLHHFDEVENYFQRKTNLGGKLEFTEKQILNSLTQAVEILELQKL